MLLYVIQRFFEKIIDGLSVYTQFQAATKSKVEELGGTFKDRISKDLTCCISASGKNLMYILTRNIRAFFRLCFSEIR